MLPAHTLKSPSDIVKHLLNVLMHYLHKQDDQADDATRALQIITKITPLIRLYQTALDRGEKQTDPEEVKPIVETEERQRLIEIILQQLQKIADD